MSSDCIPIGFHPHGLWEVSAAAGEACVRGTFLANSIMGRRSHHLPSSGSLAHLAEPVSTEPGTPAQDGWERRLGGPAEGSQDPRPPGTGLCWEGWEEAWGGPGVRALLLGVSGSPSSLRGGGAACEAGGGQGPPSSRRTPPAGLGACGPRGVHPELMSTAHTACSGSLGSRVP